MVVSVVFVFPQTTCG
uniref:Uncharacterized protein n=1 Tax=Anopheles minimus TaxID=112268 RepID=A0A182WNQ8_9DIPT